MTATVNRRTPLHQGRVFLMVRENVTLDNGVSTDLDYIEHPGAAVSSDARKRWTRSSE